jgi:anti-sigma B factor antagonist
MAAPQGNVRYHQADKTVTFRVEGRGTMTQSLPMRQCAERLMATGTSKVKVDLRDCSYMDSTFLGTLLTLKKALEKQHGQLTLVMPSESCHRILNQMGLGDVMPHESAEIDPAATWTDLSGEPTDPTSFKRTVTQAHEELAKLPGPAGEQFAAVVRCLADANKPDKPSE